jgi:protein-tyrosine phosphatase
MIDLHSHILPGIDDGSPDLATSLKMARQAVNGGTNIMACTPHIYPGMYMNDATGIVAGIQLLQMVLDHAGIALKLVQGADVHLVPDVLEGLKSGRIPTLNGSRYFLLEPSHHVAPPRFEDSVFSMMAAGYVPVITHPERLVWIETHYPKFVSLVHQGAWMQVTAGAILGKFGKRARYWSERMLDEGLVHIVSSDAHTTGMRNPNMADAREALVRRLGEGAANQLLLERPAAILLNTPVHEVLPVPALSQQGPTPRANRWGLPSWLSDLGSRNR